jgi:prevent-host-death family protein
LFFNAEGTSMTSVSITELKAHLAEYLRRVTDGERIHVTVRGTEVADLVPADPARAALWRMVENGQARWSGGKPAVPRDLPVNTGRLLSDIVMEDRGPYWDDPDPAGT